MADTKISLETTARTLDGTEHIPMVQAGANVKSNPNQIINDRKILTYDPVDNAIDYPPGTTLLDLDTIGGAPVSAQYALLATDAALPNARVLSNSTTNTINTAVAGQIQIRSVAETGDVTRPANSTINTIANDSVTNAKAANMPANTVKVNNTAADADPADLALAASQLLGRGSTGDIAPITLGTGLSMTGTTLSSSVTGTGSNSAAFKLRFSTTITQVDPGASYVRLDSATQTSAVNMVISITDADANGITNVLAGIKNNSRVMFKSVDPANSNFLQIKVTSIAIVSGTHYAINYTRTAGKAFANNEYIWMTYSADAGIYLDESKNRIKRSSDGVNIDGPLTVANIADALVSTDLDPAVEANDGMTALVLDPGENDANTLIETYPWTLSSSFAKGKLQQVNGRSQLFKTLYPIRVMCPTDGLTWTVANSLGKTKLTAAGHGLPALAANTYTFLCAKGGSGWTANTLYLINSISGNDVEINTAFTSQGSPDFYAINEQFTVLSFSIPALRLFSSCSGVLETQVTNSANSKLAVFEITNGTNSMNIWNPSAANMASVVGSNRYFSFANSKATNVQISNVASTNTNSANGTSVTAAKTVGGVDTSAKFTGRVKVTLATVGEYFEISNMDFFVTW